MIEQKYMKEGRSIDELNIVENSVMAPRPYLTVHNPVALDKIHTAS